MNLHILQGHVIAYMCGELYKVHMYYLLTILAYMIYVYTSSIITSFYIYMFVAW